MTTYGIKVKVIGVGGAGVNAVNNMIDSKIDGVGFIVCNTDGGSLARSKAPLNIQLGKELTQGLGAGANPYIGRDAALETIEELKEALSGSHVVFIIAGLGGGTGTGASPVIANLCGELGVVTIAIVSTPFSFEGNKRITIAEEGLKTLKEITDSIIIISNDKIYNITKNQNKRFSYRLKESDEVFSHIVRSIIDMILANGLDMTYPKDNTVLADEIIAKKAASSSK